MAARVGRSKEYRMGRDTQLVESGGGSPVSLFLLCGDRFQDAQLFRSGKLAVHMIRVEAHPVVSMASCTVADHQWMLSRDALVARLDNRVFLFELPGFFYAVVFPTDAVDAALADIFSRFCAYHDISAAEAGGDDANPWVRAHARIQSLIRTRMMMPSGVAQMERAVRTSAVVKLLNRSLLAGALHPDRHLAITLGDALAALPSKTVVSDILDAIETSRTTTPRRDARRNGMGCWSLNVEGVMMLLRVVQAIRNRKQQLPAATGRKRPRDEGSSNGGLRGGGAGGAAAFAGNAVRRWCGGNTVGACGRS